MSPSRQPPQTTIRPLRTCEHDALFRFYEDFEPKRAAQGLPPDNPARIRTWLDTVIARGHHLIALAPAPSPSPAGDSIIGHVMLVPFDATTVELANFVRQDWRGRGVGTALNRAAIEHARTAGWARVWLCVDPSNRAAIRSYTNAGFTPTIGMKWAPEIEMEFDLTGTCNTPAQHEPA